MDDGLKDGLSEKEGSDEEVGYVFVMCLIFYNVPTRLPP